MKILILLLLLPFVTFSQSLEDSLSTDTLPIGDITLGETIIEDYEVITPIVLDTILVDLQILYGEFTDSNIGDVINVNIDLSNPSSNVIKYNDFQRDCSCLILDLPPNPISPGGTVNMPISIERLKPGPFEQIVTIFGYDNSLKVLVQIQPIKFIAQ